jgi:hypothetical protein
MKQDHKSENAQIANESFHTIKQLGYMYQNSLSSSVSEGKPHVKHNSESGAEIKTIKNFIWGISTHARKLTENLTAQRGNQTM